LRVNLGAGFTDLFIGEGGRIIATFKVHDCRVDLFYKVDGQPHLPVYVKGLLNMLRDGLSQ
jgi:hypothetical protein